VIGRATSVISADAIATATDVVRGLLRSEAFPHPAEDIELKETHGAWVILAGPSAYKLKKPVNLGFFDFSTREKRDADAEAEVRLNRRLAPSTYLGLVDIVERDGAIHIGGPGRVLERAVWMRSLPRAGMLSELLRNDQVSPSLIRRIARRMSTFHAGAESGPGIDEFGGPSTLEANWQENFDQIRPFVDTTIPRSELLALERFVTQMLDEKRTLFQQRVDEGRICDGHGDLHADSICVVGKDLVIFDCIQFSPRYRCADVVAEIAFLAMDLDHAGRADLAWTFVDEYVRRTRDAELLDLLPLYKCYRAFVRGKVLSLRLAQVDLTLEERENLVVAARSYFDLATSYIDALNRIHLLVMTGLPASGKTTLARALATRLGLMHLSTDVVRKRRASLVATDPASSPFRSGIYSEDSTRKTYAALRRRARTWLRRGVSVVLDGTFGDRKQRSLVRQLADREGARFLLVQTVCDEESARLRVEKREIDPARVSDADWDVRQQLVRVYQPPSEIPPNELFVDLTGGGGGEQLVRRLLGIETKTPEAS
jgi:uncharacterized protein